MPRKRIGAEPLSNTEKQRRYRAKNREIKQKWKELQAAGQGAVQAPATGAVDAATLREAIKAEIIAEYEKSLKAQWARETQAEKIKTTRKAARESEQKKQQRRGFIHCMAQVCIFFEKRDRHDIAGELLKHFYIEQSDFENPDNAIHKLLREDLQRYKLIKG